MPRTHLANSFCKSRTSLLHVWATAFWWYICMWSVFVQTEVVPSPQVDSLLPVAYSKHSCADIFSKPWPSISCILTTFKTLGRQKCIAMGHWPSKVWFFFFFLAFWSHRNRGALNSIHFLLSLKNSICHYREWILYVIIGNWIMSLFQCCSRVRWYCQMISKHH